MLQYIARRLLQFIPVFFGVTLILFLITTILPGDPVQMRVGEKSMSPAVYEQLRHDYGLDQPWYVQYVELPGATSHRGDLGTVHHHRAARSATSSPRRYPYTVKLAFAAIIIEIIVGIGVGIVSAVKRTRIWDVLVDAVTSILVSLPGVLARHHAPVRLRDLAEGCDERRSSTCRSRAARAAASRRGRT